MADAEATALLRVKADTSQAVRETDKVTDAQKNLGKQLQVNVGFFNQLKDSASGGMKTIKTTLTELNQGLQIVEKVVKAVDKAVDSQLVERANQFGLKVKNASDAASALNDVMKKTPDKLDETTRGLLKTNDAFDSLGRNINKIIAEIAVPLVVELASRVEDLIEYGSDFIDMISSGGVTRRRIAEQNNRAAQAKLAGERFRADIAHAGALGGADSIYNQGAVPLMSDEYYYNQLTSNLAAPRAGNYNLPGTGPRGSKSGAIPVVVVGGSLFGEGRTFEGSLGGEFYRDWTGYRPGGAVGSAEGISFGGMGGLGKGFEGVKKLVGGMEKDPDPFGLGDSTTAAGAAYSTLAAGITAAVDAAITGSDSIGKAAAKASAAVLKSLSVEAAGRAVYEGAMAIGSLAISDFKGASMHGLAAAKYAAAAALTGTMAAGLGALANGGGGGGGAAAPAPGGGFGAAVGGSSGGGQTNITINVGHGFAGDVKGIEQAVVNALRSAERRGTGRPAFAATRFDG